MKFEKEIQFLEHNRHIISDEFLFFVRGEKDETELTTDILKDYGFICERERSSETDLDGIWYNAFNLCEDHYDGTINFAVYVRSTGCMKSGMP